MTDRDVPDSGQTFRIGAVSRLTGVPTDTLRVWERRYHVVVPVRSKAGTRHYAAEDVWRLSLIKRLVDGGDAISSVANLSLHDLGERMRGVDIPERFSAAERPCRVVVCGPYLADRLRQETKRPTDIEFLGFFTSTQTLMASASARTADILVLDYPTLHPEQAREINQLRLRFGAAHVLLVYGFASRSAISVLDAAHIVARRAPIGIDELHHWCLSRLCTPRAQSEHADMALFAGLGVPLERRFNTADLARLSATAAPGEYDLPRHLIDLVSALSAFESYSVECGGRDDDEVAMIAVLRACAIRARALMEIALERAVSVEGRQSGLNHRDISR